MRVKHKEIPFPQRTFDMEVEKPRYKELKKEFGHKKKLPHGYGLQALIALSYYPELKDIAIEFRFGFKINSLSAIPTIPSMFLAAKERTYLIIISTKIRKAKGAVMMKNLNFNAQIGVLAHELAHVTDFIHRPVFDMAQVGIFYYIPEFQKKLESGTDLIAIKHGLGYQILEYSKLIHTLQAKFLKESYYQTYYHTYLNPEQIMRKIKTLKRYKGI